MGRKVRTSRVEIGLRLSKTNDQARLQDGERVSPNSFEGEGKGLDK